MARQWLTPEISGFVGRLVVFCLNAVLRHLFSFQTVRPGGSMRGVQEGPWFSRAFGKEGEVRSGLTFKYSCSSTKTLQEVTKKVLNWKNLEIREKKALSNRRFVWYEVITLIKGEPLIFRSCFIAHFQLEKKVNVVDMWMSPTKSSNGCHALRLNCGMMTNRSVSGYQPHIHSDVYSACSCGLENMMEQDLAQLKFHSSCSTLLLRIL